MLTLRFIDATKTGAGALVIYGFIGLGTGGAFAFCFLPSARQISSLTDQLVLMATVTGLFSISGFVAGFGSSWFWDGCPEEQQS